MNWKIPLFKVNMPENITIDDLLHSGFIGQGKYVDNFEKKFAETFKLNCKKVVSLNSCTSAIQMALKLIGIDYGDEVVTTPYTMIATNIHIDKGKIVWYDVDKNTGLVTLENIKKVITNKTKVVILVHISGTITPELDKIIEYCHDKEIFVIEDAAQSLGATFNNNYIFHDSDFVAFSFQATKHLTTIDRKNKEYKRAIDRIIFFFEHLFATPHAIIKKDVLIIASKIVMNSLSKQGAALGGIRFWDKILTYIIAIFGNKANVPCLSTVRTLRKDTKSVYDFTLCRPELEPDTSYSTILSRLSVDDPLARLLSNIDGIKEIEARIFNQNIFSKPSTHSLKLPKEIEDCMPRNTPSSIQEIQKIKTLINAFPLC